MTLLKVFKFHYAKMLESPSLYKDGICSLIGTVLAGALFINTLIIKNNPNMWLIDPTVSFFCGIAAMFIGFQAIYLAKYRDSLPIFNLTWWFLSQGDGMDEISGRPLDPSDFGHKESDVELTGSGNEDDGEII